MLNLCKVTAITNALSNLIISLVCERVTTWKKIIRKSVYSRMRRVAYFL